MNRFIQLLFCLLLASPGWAAWGAVSTSCWNSSEAASSTSLACSVSGGNIEAGNVAVVVCATDNVSGSGNTNDHSAVTDSVGNTYTKAYEFTEGTGGAAGGATISLHFSKLTTQLSATGTITCNFASVTDKAMHLIGEFTIGAGNTVSVAGTPVGAESDGGDAPSQTVGSLTSGEYLWVRGIATESNGAISMTATSGGLFALPLDPSDGCNNTTGGGEASDMGACSEWDIATGTTNTSDPTLVDTSNDNASVFVALQEAAPAAASGVGWYGPSGWW